MPRGHRATGPMERVPVPAGLRAYFNVPYFMVSMHGRGRKPKHPKHHHHLHGRGRHPDVWHGKGAIRQG